MIPRLGSRPRTALLAAIMVLAVVPLGTTLAASEASDDCVLGEKTQDYFTATTPLDESFPASELVHVIGEETDLNQRMKYANGIDAYVVELSCIVHSENYAFLAKGLDTGGQDYDLSVQFFDEDYQAVGEVHDDDHGDELGSVPVGARYATVTMEEGPLFSGVTRDSSWGVIPRPYAMGFSFQMDIGEA